MARKVNKAIKNFVDNDINLSALKDGLEQLADALKVKIAEIYTQEQVSKNKKKAIRRSRKK